MFKLETVSLNLILVILLFTLGIVLSSLNQFSSDDDDTSQRDLIIGFILVSCSCIVGGYRWTMTQLLHAYDTGPNNENKNEDGNENQGHHSHSMTEESEDRKVESSTDVHLEEREISMDSNAATDHGDDIDYFLMEDGSELDSENPTEKFLIPSTLKHISTFSVMYYVSLPAFLFCIPFFAGLGLYVQYT